MKNKYVKWWKLMYFFLLGHLLLLTSAVFENGSTDFSKKLVPRFSDVPEMLEALLASMAVLVLWAVVFCYIERNEQNRDK
ncbi:MAG: hypothetical protein E7660_02170 [Ruminococcaceae bacterium]|nr:hypothetical protein [Oscillospiraceae bacterium]